MYTRKKPVTVEKTYYYSDDGHEFSSESECENYERRKSGTRKECEHCHGWGKMMGDWIPEKRFADSTGEIVQEGHYRTCPVCHGKGYLDKHVTTTWE